MAGDSRLPRGVAPGTIIANRYRLLRLIGEGGMGVVFEAETSTGARVAVKLLRLAEGGASEAAAAAEARARFERESSMSFRLRAAHVVAVHDHGIDPHLGLPF